MPTLSESFYPAEETRALRLYLAINTMAKNSISSA